MLNLRFSIYQISTLRQNCTKSFTWVLPTTGLREQVHRCVFFTIHSVSSFYDMVGNEGHMKTWIVLNKLQNRNTWNMYSRKILSWASKVTLLEHKNIYKYAYKKVNFTGKISSWWGKRSVSLDTKKTKMGLNSLETQVGQESMYNTNAQMVAST